MISIVRRNQEIKDQVRKFREKGASFSQIQKKFGIPKSTLHYWVRDLGPSPFQSPEAKAKHFKKIQKLGALANKKKKEMGLKKIIQQCRKDVRLIQLNNPFLKSMAAMLYWAEGAKYDGNASVKFVNTDPRLMALFLKLFRSCFVLDEKKIRIRLHLHHYHKINEAKKFWSELLKVPLNQFGKIYIKQRSTTKRFRKNFMGICFVSYHDVKLLRYILNFGFELAEKVNKDVPVVQRIERFPAEEKVGRSIRPRDTATAKQIG